MVFKMNRLGYFKLTPPEKRSNSKAFFKQELFYGETLFVIWNIDQDFSEDYRSFILEEDLDNEAIRLDKSRFDSTCAAIGLDIRLGNFRDISDESRELEFSVNGTRHVCRDNRGDDFVFFSEFEQILSSELHKIKSKEKAIIWGKFPARLVFLDDQLVKYAAFDRSKMDFLPSYDHIN